VASAPFKVTSDWAIGDLRDFAAARGVRAGGGSCSRPGLAGLTEPSHPRLHAGAGHFYRSPGRDSGGVLQAVGAVGVWCALADQAGDLVPREALTRSRCASGMSHGLAYPAWLELDRSAAPFGSVAEARVSMARAAAGNHSRARPCGHRAARTSIGGVLAKGRRAIGSSVTNSVMPRWPGQKSAQPWYRREGSSS